MKSRAGELGFAIGVFFFWRLAWLGAALRLGLRRFICFLLTGLWFWRLAFADGVGYMYSMGKCLFGARPRRKAGVGGSWVLGMDKGVFVSSRGNTRTCLEMDIGLYLNQYDVIRRWNVVLQKVQS